MKRIIALLLAMAMLLTGCGVSANQSDIPSETVEETTEQTQQINIEDDVPEFESLADADLPEYMEDAVYTELVDTLNEELYYVESVETAFVSKEYLEEIAYNSQSNIFFGYTLAELDECFQGQKYIFTLGDDGKTEVEEFQPYDDTYDKVIKNVAIGTGVILVCVTVAIVTKNPAASATAGKTVKLIFTASSMGAKAGTKMALQGAALGGTVSALLEALKTNDLEEIKKAALLGASDSFKWSAIFGTVKGVADGIRVVENTRYFATGTEQAAKYPEGVEFTASADGITYPRFEKYAKAIAKFDTPTLEAATNHTGLSGNYYWDSKLANAQCGFARTPEGYVWHHVEDMKTMILVPQDLHSIAFGGMSHTGGASLIKKFLGL